MKTLMLTGTSEVLVFEPRPDPVPPGGSLVRLRERVPMAATVTIRKEAGGYRVKATWYTHEYGMMGPESFKENVLSAQVDGLKVCAHKDMFETEWTDVNGTGKKVSFWMSTPTPETWERLHVWVKYDDRPVYGLERPVEFEIIRLDADSQAAMRRFVVSLGQLEMAR